MAKDTKKTPTKSQVYAELAEGAGISRKQVQEVFTALEGLIKKNLKKDGDVFKVPGLFRLRLVRKKATKGGEMRRNPFTGEMVAAKPKPASNDVRVRALKALKDMVQ
jgi:nucleoid DNA-binding protein